MYILYPQIYFYHSFGSYVLFVMVVNTEQSIRLKYLLYFLCYADPSNQLTPFALVVYRFAQAEDHPVLIKPHGNAKHSKPYQRT